MDSIERSLVPAAKTQIDIDREMPLKLIVTVAALLLVVLVACGGESKVLATSKSGTHWEPRDQGLDGGLVSSLRALL